MSARPRVVVTHPRTAAARHAPRRGVRRDVTDQTPLGETMLRSLRAAQLRLAYLVGLGLAVMLGGIPLLFLLFPSLDRARVVGLPIGWLVLGFAVFPVIIGLALLYARAAERNERRFQDLVDRT